MNLYGERVYLRAMEPADAGTLWRWNHDPEVMRWMNDGYPQTIATTIARAQAWPRNSYEKVMLGIRLRDGDRLIGVIVLRSAEPELGRAEVDIYLGEKDTWGQGHATEALRLACGFGFEQMRLHAIALSVVADNAAARRVYEKVGFVEEGRRRESFRRDGRWYDDVVMSILDHEWEKLAGR